MSDLFQGQTMTEAFKCISAGTAETFTFGFEPDKVTFYNITHWTATAGKLPISVWIRGLVADTDALQEQVIDSSAGASFNFLLEGTNGFTVANTDGGAPDYGKLIAGVSTADPCVVTTTAAHGYTTGMILMVTDLGSDMPVARGMEQINNKRYKIVVTGNTTFSLQDVITGEAIDSTAYTAWVAGKRVQLETRVIPTFNDPFRYDPITYKLTAGTAVMGANSDVIFIEAIRYGNRIVDLGDLA
jgi:hypothetical protein